MYEDKSNLGGSILRPLNSKDAKQIATPFLQNVLSYEQKAENVEFFQFMLSGKGKGVFNDKVVSYEVYLLTGPETTKDELSTLKKINQTEISSKPKCCMNEEVFEIMKKSSYRMIVLDNDQHNQFWSVIEQTNILGTDTAFGRIVDSANFNLAVGYWNVNSISHEGQSRDFTSKAIL